MKYIKQGVAIRSDGKIFKCIVGNHCKDCAFEDTLDCYKFECISTYRKDSTDVIFKEVKK